LRAGAFVVIRNCSCRCDESILRPYRFSLNLGESLTDLGQGFRPARICIKLGLWVQSFDLHSFARRVAGEKRYATS
jgi:hypothetical protein